MGQTFPVSEPELQVQSGKHEISPRLRSGRLAPKLGVLLVSGMIGLSVCELGLRTLYREERSAASDAANLSYHYDRQLGWFPSAKSKARITGSRTVTAIHNRDGLRGPEGTPSNKPGIVFLGDSLVWGFDVEAHERFTEKLQTKHPEWAIYNFGVSGYGTDQEYLLLQRYFERYRPRLVFLVICGDNDNEDNAWNFRGGYYKPYFTLEKGQLKLNGVPVPKSARTFYAEHRVWSRSMIVRLCARGYYRLRSPRPKKNPDPPTGVLLLEMRKYVVENGASFAVGLQHSQAELEQFLRQFRIRYVDLSTTNSGHTYSRFGNHWTPEGHSFVAEKIDRFLRENRRAD